MIIGTITSGKNTTIQKQVKGGHISGRITGVTSDVVDLLGRIHRSWFSKYFGRKFNSPTGKAFANIKGTRTLLTPSGLHANIVVGQSGDPLIRLRLGRGKPVCFPLGPWVKTEYLKLK